MAQRVIFVLITFLGWNCSATEISPEPSSPSEALTADWLLIASAAEDKGSWEEAGHALDSWALLDEINSSWVERRIRAADGSGDWETAAVWRAHALARNPHDIALRVDLADDLQRLGRIEEAISTLTEVTEDEELGVVALAALGEIYKREGEYLMAAQALEDLASVLEDPQAASWWQAASQLREKGGDLEGAVAALEKALNSQGLFEDERRRLERLAAFQTGEPRNVADAVGLLNSHVNPDFRLSGIRYLSLGEFPDELKVFGVALRDPDPRVVIVAAAEIGKRGSSADRFLLYPLFGHSSREVRLGALRGISPIAEIDDFPLILPFLQPEDRQVFRAANRVLESASGHIVAIDIDPDEERRGEIASLWNSWYEKQAQS